MTLETVMETCVWSYGPAGARNGLRQARAIDIT